MDILKKNIWNSPLLRSKAKKEVGLAEMFFGYFIGPFCVLAMTSVVGSYYLTFYRTYDDIVNQGAFLTLLPLVSVIPMAVTNIIVGIVVGKSQALYLDGRAAVTGVRDFDVLHPLPFTGGAHGVDGRHL